VLQGLSRIAGWSLIFAGRIMLLAAHVLLSSVVQAAAGLWRGVREDCERLRTTARDPRNEDP
jgi:hypothetical protein